MDTKTSDRNGHFPHNFLYESKTHSSYTRVVYVLFAFTRNQIITQKKAMLDAIRILFEKNYSIRIDSNSTRRASNSSHPVSVLSFSSISVSAASLA